MIRNGRIKKGVVVFLFIVAIFVRLSLIFVTSSTGDELWLISMTHNSLTNIWIGTLADGNAPFNFIYLHFIGALVGHPEKELVLFRLQSLVFSMIAVGCLWYLAMLVSNKKVAIVTVLLSLFLPSTVWISVIARHYGLLLLQSTLLFIFYIRFLQQKKTRDLICYTIVAIIGMYTHFYFSLLVVSLSTSFFFEKINNKMLAKWLVSLLSISLLFLPLLVSFFNTPQYEISNIHNSLLKIPGSFLAYVTSFLTLLFLQSQGFLLGYYVIFFSLFLVSVYLFMNGLRLWNKRMMFPFVSSLLIPPVIILFVSYTVKAVFFVNSLLIFLPAFIIILAQGIQKDFQHKKIATILFIFCVAIVYVPFLSALYQSTTEFTQPFLYLHSVYKPGDIILHADMYTFLGAEYYVKKGVNYGITPTIYTRVTEATHGYKIISVKTIQQTNGRIWYIQPQFYNFPRAQEAKQDLDKHFVIKTKAYFKASDVFIYLYEKEHGK